MPGPLMSREEVAELLGISPESVRKTLSRAGITEQRGYLSTAVVTLQRRGRGYRTDIHPPHQGDPVTAELAHDWPTVNDLFTEEITASGLDINDLNDTSQAVVAALGPSLDGIIAPLAQNSEALHVAAAALRSYARIAEMYASARDAEAGA